MNQQYYTDLAGGVLESAGRLFKRTVKLYVYPCLDPESGQVCTVENAPLPSPWEHLRALLLETGRLEAIRNYNESYLRIFTQEVLAQIERNELGWEAKVPPTVAGMIKANRLFSYPATTTTTTTAAAHDGKARLKAHDYTNDYNSLTKRRTV